MTSTALLIMDVQQGIVDRFGGEAGYLPSLGSAIKAAHQAGIPVIYVGGWRSAAGTPEVSPRNRSFGAIWPGPGLVRVRGTRPREVHAGRGAHGARGRGR